MFWLTGRRRRKVRARPVPARWEEILGRLVPLFLHLPPEDREELLGHLAVLLDEKRFEGAAGLDVTEEMRVAVMGWGALPLLHRPTDYYPGLFSVVLYPEAFMVRQVSQDDAGVVAEEDEERIGESWSQGTLVLAWDEVVADAASPGDGFNVTLHEFAHQLDAEDGRLDGAPVLPAASRRAWSEIMQREYGRLGRRAVRGLRTLLDPYGAEDPAEFFAVVTEAFFETPGNLSGTHPDLYRVLREYYRQDPAAWPR